MFVIFLPSSSVLLLSIPILPECLMVEGHLLMFLLLLSLLFSLAQPRSIDPTYSLDRSISFDCLFMFNCYSLYWSYLVHRSTVLLILYNMHVADRLFYFFAKNIRLFLSSQVPESMQLYAKRC